MPKRPRGKHDYPEGDLRVLPFKGAFEALLPHPRGFVEDTWPPDQVTYLRLYLEKEGCKTVVVETHYVDRDYIYDVSLFYARSLRAYPNFCTRVHFFKTAFDQKEWRRLVTGARTPEERAKRSQSLGEAYLGFTVLRPLPGSPIGRTVLPTVGPVSASGHTRRFDTIREYRVHLAGFTFNVRGLAFQQQDQGVSACATTALWSALHRMAHLEGLTIPTPAEITEAASRYVLPGRSLPSEGLSMDQVCEATRAVGLSPLVIRCIDPAHDRAQLLSYMRSGFAPVLALQPDDGGADGHAVCGVGIKLGEIDPQTDPNLSFRDESTAVVGVFVHDDRLGPYASADLFSNTSTTDGTVKTWLSLEWPDGGEVEFSQLTAIVVPAPVKLRLTVTRMRVLGHAVAQAASTLFPAFGREITLGTRYARNTAYRQDAHGFGLSAAGLYDLACRVVLSRYVGVIEITTPKGPLFDVLLDATETTANPATLACVRRHALPKGDEVLLKGIAAKFGARCLL